VQIVNKMEQPVEAIQERINQLQHEEEQIVDLVTREEKMKET
jgi:hypothetical protein